VRHVDGGVGSDCYLIQWVAASEFNVIMSLEEAHELWQAYSSEQFASWMRAKTREDIHRGLAEILSKIYPDYVDTDSPLFPKDSCPGCLVHGMLHLEACPRRPREKT